jgi:hypothetical protein
MSELATKEKKIDKVSWENVLIIKEYLNYLQKDDIFELCLLSKLIRQKLKYQLFKNIKFNGLHFESYLNNSNSLIWGSFEFIKYYKTYFSVEGFDKSPYTGIKIEDSLQELQNDLINVSSVVKSFEYSNTLRGGYYLFPLLHKFANLATLRIFDCDIPLIEFCKLLKNLKLENLDICNSSFAKLPTEELTTEDIQFPRTLKTLSISTCNFYSDDLLSNPHEYLFEKANSGKISEFKLPSTIIPSLTSFTLETQYSDDYGSSQFISNNPQLEHLMMESNHLDKAKFDYIAKSKTLKNLELICTTSEHHEISISTPPPTLESIKELRFYNVSDEIYYILEDLCLISTNLSSLYFVLCEMPFDFTLVTINNILNNIVPNAPNLKLLCLGFLAELYDPIDFTNLNGVEKLIIETNISNIVQIGFLECSSLKEIVLNFAHTEYDDYEFNFDDAKDEFDQLEDWKFEFSIGSIKGVRV